MSATDDRTRCELCFFIEHSIICIFIFAFLVLVAIHRHRSCFYSPERFYALLFCYRSYDFTDNIDYCLRVFRCIKRIWCHRIQIWLSEHQKCLSRNVFYDKYRCFEWYESHKKLSDFREFEKWTYGTWRIYGGHTFSGRYSHSSDIMFYGLEPLFAHTFRNG